MKENDKFKELLDENYTWPSVYMFKFIVPKDQLKLAKQILLNFEVIEKPSSKGTYVSLTARKELTSSEEVMSVYKKMAIIEGVVSL